MHILIDGQIINKKTIELDIYSPFLHFGLGLKRSILYYDGNLLWFEDHIDQITHDAYKMKFEFKKEYFSQEKILYLLEKNDLLDETALVKILCLKDVVGCNTLVLTHSYQLPEYKTIAALHNEPIIHSFDRHSNICEAEQVYWVEYYGEKFDTDQVLFVNNKGRIIQAFEANVIAVWNNNLYYVYPGANYRPTIIQQKILASASELGIKKLLDKSKGLSLDLMERADEIVLISDTFIAQTVSAIIRPTGAVINTSSKATKDWAHSFTKRLRDFFLENN